MAASTTIHSPQRLRRTAFAGVATAIALAGGAAIAFTGGDAPPADTPSRETASSLTPEAQRYVDWVVSATPEQLVATFGYGPVGPVRPVRSGTAVR